MKSYDIIEYTADVGIRASSIACPVINITKKIKIKKYADRKIDRELFGRNGIIVKAIKG
ncbi:MAG: hypothetical protein KKH08_03595 [Candidatus Omnitrophica bacterium]|nr:hypothetical protein [Candidatus Omnitrophota bacterium]